MKDRVFKAVWVDNQKRMWSAMSGVRGFYHKRNQMGGTPLRYAKGKVVVPPTHGQKYLFAFASVSCAVRWATMEFNGRADDGLILPSTNLRLFERGYIKGKRYNRGHVEIWEAEGDVCDLDERAELYYKLLVYGAPTGTLLCKSIRLLAQVDNLF